MYKTVGIAMKLFRESLGRKEIVRNVIPVTVKTIIIIVIKFRACDAPVYVYTIIYSPDIF